MCKTEINRIVPDVYKRQALRCNIVTISEDDVPFEEQKIIDHSSGEISTEDCAVLLNEVKKELENEKMCIRDRYWTENVCPKLCGSK